MIRRNTSNAHNYVEQLEESQFVGSRGIDVTKPCTSPDSVIDMCNLDVDSDGGLSIRKPLICERKFSLYDGRTPGKFFMAFDGNTELEMYEEKTLKYWVLWIGTIQGFYLKYTKYTGEVVDYSPITDRIYGDFRYATIVNTPNSTIITNVKIDYTHYELVDPVLRPVSENEDKMVYRYLRLTPTDDGDVWQVEIINPEINMFNSAEAAVLNPNLTLDSAYTLRDNYNAVSVGVTNILAYAIASDLTPPRLDITKTFNGYTIKELTEKTIGLRPQILNTLKKDSKDSKDFPVCLKAFVDVQPSDKSSYVCLWEKTFDGVNWEEVSEFIDDKCVLLEIPDSAVSNESLTTSGTYKTSKKCKIFNPKSSNDLITDRPDCLILHNFDNATYRFTIYSINRYIQTDVEEGVSVDFENTLLKLSDLYLDTNPGITLYNEAMILQSEKYKSTDYYRVDTAVTTVGATGMSKNYIRYFKIVLKLQNPNVKVDLNKFKIRVVDKENVHNATLTPGNIQRNGTRFEDYDVSYGLEVEVSNNSSETWITLKGAFPIGELYSFYEMCPTLLKIYYGDALYYTYKIMFNRFLNKWYIPTETSTDVYDKVHLEYSSSYTQKEDGTFPLKAIPFPTDVLKQLKDIVVGGAIVHSGKFGAYLDNVSKEMVDVKTYTFTYQLAIGNLKKGNEATVTLDTTTQYNNLTKTYNLTGKSSFYDVEYSFLVNENKNKNVYEMFIYQDIYGTEPDMDTYITVKSTSESQNLPEVYDIVDVTDAEPFIKEFLEVKLNLGSKTYTFTFADSVEFIYNDIYNTVNGYKFYYKHAIYSYGVYFGTNIYPTDVNSFITPLFNVIDLVSTGSGIVTTLTPWRDYLVAATTDSIHLITKADGGYYTKLVNSFIGVPIIDRRTCKAILNGIIFKSGCKVYALTPNANSGDDTILNITDLSKPIEGLIPTTDYAGIDNFAFTTENAYYLFIPQKYDTVCFKYEYARKIWTKFVYPVVLLDYCIRSVEDILLFSKDRAFYFNKDITDLYPNAAENLRYGDILEPTEGRDVATYIENVQVTPIPYYVNSGQKTDRMSVTKQFKESKIVLATISPKFVFPFAIDISVDGTLYNIHKDANTDGSLWKTSETSVGATGMTLTTSTSNIFNIIRQMYIRYSGRGKTIQHIISGDSYFNFKIYMVNYRYRILNVKQ